MSGQRRTAGITSSRLKKHTGSHELGTSTVSIAILMDRLGRRDLSLGRTEVPSDEDAETPCPEESVHEETGGPGELFRPRDDDLPDGVALQKDVAVTDSLEHSADEHGGDDVPVGSPLSSAVVIGPLVSSEASGSGSMLLTDAVPVPAPNALDRGLEVQDPLMC